MHYHPLFLPKLYLDRETVFMNVIRCLCSFYFRIFISKMFFEDLKFLMELIFDIFVPYIEEDLKKIL